MSSFTGSVQFPGGYIHFFLCVSVTITYDSDGLSQIRYNKNEEVLWSCWGGILMSWAKQEDGTYKLVHGESGQSKPLSDGRLEQFE